MNPFAPDFQILIDPQTQEARILLLKLLLAALVFLLACRVEQDLRYKEDTDPL